MFQLRFLRKIMLPQPWPFVSEEIQTYGTITPFYIGGYVRLDTLGMSSDACGCLWMAYSTANRPSRMADLSTVLESSILYCSHGWLGVPVADFAVACHWQGQSFQRRRQIAPACKAEDNAHVVGRISLWLSNSHTRTCDAGGATLLIGVRRLLVYVRSTVVVSHWQRKLLP
jgi:hypothetical protein